jgi:apolipoprotein N-acyltransferase
MSISSLESSHICVLSRPWDAGAPTLGHSSGRVFPLWAALVVAAGAGPVLDAGFPDKGYWPLTFVGIALVLVTLIGQRAGSAFLLGFVSGMAFYLTQIQWASLFLGPLPMTALSFLESLFFGLGAATIALAYRWVPRAFPTWFGRWIMLPVAVAGLWTAREAWASVWPYGGFAWGRVALSQSDSPFSPLFAWIGISGLSFVMVLIAATSLSLVLLALRPHPPRTSEGATMRLALLRAALVPVAITAIALVVPTFPVATDGTLRVAAVQGNGKAGYFDQRAPGDLLQAQLSATAPLFGQHVDVLLWPEGATDYSPLDDPYTAQVFDFVSHQLHAPLVGWAVTQRGDKSYNTELLWDHGAVLDHYDKKHPVPFGEYVPDRAFWEPFAPDLIGLIGREYTPGTTDNVFNINGVIAGVNICFDIVDDKILTESVQEGAQVIFASSNNADFGHTDESAQQLSIARIRSMELGRSVVNISTVGLSAVIAPDGRIVQQLPWYTAATMVQDVQLSTVTTPAVVIGRDLEWFVSGLGLSILLISGFAVRRPRIA